MELTVLRSTRNIYVKNFHQSNWLIFNQTPKSPVISVKDVCLLSMCSKAVSSDKALIIGSNILIGG